MGFEFKALIQDSLKNLAASPQWIVRSSLFRSGFITSPKLERYVIYVDASLEYVGVSQLWGITAPGEVTLEEKGSCRRLGLIGAVLFRWELVNVAEVPERMRQDFLIVVGLG